MPSNYSGNPSNITTSLSRSIVTCTSGSGGVVLVQTSGAHEFSTYDFVSVSGVTGTTEANGVSQITVVDSTHFSLDGSAFVNPYSTGGTADDLSLTPYFQIPDDGEAGTAQSIEASIQALADRTQFIWDNMIGAIGNGTVHVEALSTGTWTSSPNAAPIAILIGCGGGGGGGGGCAGANNVTDTWSPGGGGGGGTHLLTQYVSIAKDTDYAVTIGAGGTGGTGGIADNETGTDGGDGGNTIFGTQALFAGAQGGRGGSARVTDNAEAAYSPGGASTRGSPQALRQAVTLTASNYSWAPQGGPAFGGSGRAATTAGQTTSTVSDGGANPTANAGTIYAGGSGGTNGTNDGSFRAGGAGGGGGAGPFGVGGTGGNGGDGNSGGAGGSGSGNSAGAGHGSGGGGGGAGGAGSTLQGLGGDGRAGTTGALYIIWFGVSP